MAVPKRKTSKMRKRQRKAQIKHAYPSPSASSAGGSDLHLPHRVCPTTGMYKGRQVLVVNADE